MLQRKSTSPTKDIILFKNNMFFSYYYNIENNQYTIFINKYVAISISTLSTITAAYLLKNIFNYYFIN